MGFGGWVSVNKHSDLSGLRAFPDHGKTVAERQNQLLHPRVIGYLLSKGTQGHGFGVAVDGVGDFPAPQHIIRENEATRAQPIDHQIIVEAVVFFVGIEEDQVERAFYVGDDLRRRPPIRAQLVSTPASAEKLIHDGLQLGVNVDGVQESTFGEAFGQAKCRVARKGAHLQDAAGLHQPAHELEK